jgi:2-dehydro-3-deoxyglucarate aldolase/4-hydroxy-2-oxoheptanedioate aldolase
MEDAFILRTKEKILKCQLVVGTHVKLPAPQISEIIARCGIDIVWIDGEHGGMDKKDIDLHIMAVKSAGAAPFVRIPWNDPVLAKPILEMGPSGIIFPLIRTSEDAKKAVESCKYPPKGVRGFGPNRAMDFGNMEIDEYLKKSESDPWLIIQIESEEGINNLGEILKVDGIDTVVIGPNDLSGSIGVLGQVRHPKVLKLMDKFAGTCKEVGIPFGASIGFNEENIKDWVNRGVCWICIDTDISFLVAGTKRVINHIANFNECRSDKKFKSNYPDKSFIKAITEEVVDKLNKENKM